MLKGILFTLTLVVFGSGSVWAQESAASQTFKQHLRGQYLQSDTAQAIINLYSRRQAGGASWIIGAALSAVRIATASSSSTSSAGGYVVHDDAPNTGAVFLVASPIAAYGVGKIVHYSNGNLERILTDYAAGKPLARSLRRKLKPRFFAQPIIKYQPVNAQPTK